MKWALLTIVILISPIQASGATVEPPCMITGCSGEVCIHENDAGNISSTCVWSGAFECYSYYGVCKPMKDGSCGWSKNYDLQQCLKHHNYDGKQELTPYREEEHIKDRRR